MAQNLFTQVFGLLLFAIQAPLLGPRAFGLIALVMVFIGFCEIVVEVASSDALISVRDIDAKHYATMTSANAIFALTLGLCVCFFAGDIAAFFKEPELAPILRWMSVLPLVSALASAPNAASRRAMQFKPLAQRVLISTVIGGVVGLVLTFLHYGVWALVWQTMLQRVLNVVILWRLVDLPFRLGISRPHWRELWRYGGPMLLSQTMSWCTAQVPRSIMGLYLGAAELGLFTLGARIHEMVLQLTLSPGFAVARVELRRFLDDTRGIDAAMTRLLQQMAFLCFPICIGGAVVMPVLFHVWLDARWAGGVFAAQLMLLGAIPYVTHYGLSAALLAMNRQSLIAVNSTVQAIATVVVVAIFAPFGLTPATAAIALRPLATATIPMVYARRHCGISATKVLRAQVPLILAALGMGAAVWTMSHLLAPHLRAGVLLVALIAVGAIVYALLLAVFAPQIAARYRERLGFRAT